MKEGYIETFAKGLRSSDHLVLLPIYYAGGTAAKDISSGDLAEGVAASGRYALIQDAYDAASNGDDILILSSDFIENLEFDHPVSITLQGGCSPDFFNITGCTVLDGDLTISNGTVIIEDLIIK